MQGVGTFAGIRKTRLVMVRHRLQWAPFQRTVLYSSLAPLQHGVLGVECSNHSVPTI